MPQDFSRLALLGEGYDPLAQGIASRRRTGFEGVPGFGGGGLGSLAAMGMMPGMHRMFGEVGMTPMGVGHDQNVFDTMQDLRFTQMQMQAMQAAAQSDRENFMRTMRGMAALTGTPYGAQQRNAASALASGMVTAAPLLAQIMPDLMDQFGGARGSAAVMASRMLDAGRYRLDPVTGRMGMSAESTGQAARQMFSDLYSDANLPQMQGVTAGQLGSLFSQLQMRGMIRGGASTDAVNFGAQSQATRAVGELMRNVTGGSDMGIDSTMADRLRNFDTERISRSLRSYVGAVSAMRDIFGDMGRPNAPMQDLMRGLEALTAGSMAQIDPARLGTMARTTYNLARQTGVSLDGALMLQQHAASRVAQMGLPPIFAVEATQGALAFGGAYNALGQGAHTSWGAFNSTQVTQLDANLRAQAAGSNMANRMNVAMRISDTMGGFAPGSDPARYAQAIRYGLNQWTDSSGQTRSALVSDSDFVGMMSSARGANGQALGLSQGDVMTMLQQTGTNLEYGQRYGTGAIARRAQGTDELHPFVAGQMQATLATRLRERLISQGVAPAAAQAEANAAAARVSARATQRMFGMSGEAFSSNFNASVGNIIGQELDAAGMGGVLRGPDRNNFLASTADIFQGTTNLNLGASPFSGFGNLNNIYRLTNAQTLNESDRSRMQTNFASAMQDALSPLGHGSILSRAVDAVQHSRSSDPSALSSVIGQALGGVRTNDINQAMLRPMTEIRTRRLAIEQLRDQISREPNPQARAGLVAQLDTAMGELRGQVNSLAQLGERFGLFQGEALSVQDVTNARTSSAELSASQLDLVGLRGGFGHDVSPGELAAARARTGPATRTEAVAVLTARRMQSVQQLRDYLSASADVGELERRGITGGELATARIRASSLRDPATEQLWRAEVANVRRSRPGLSPQAANDMALANLESAAGDERGMDIAGQMANLNVGSDAEARALVRTLRRQTPMRASEDEIAGIVAQHPGISQADAAELANARLRAARLGVAVPGAGTLGPLQEIEAISAALQSASGAQYSVSAADRAEFRRANPQHSAASDSSVDSMVLTGRYGASRDRFRQFWGSSDGEGQRERTETSGNDAETVAMRLISTPHMARRLGTRATTMSRQLHGGQSRLQELARFHTNGDVARLLAGDYNIDWSRPGGAATAARVRSEVDQIVQQRRGIMDELQDQVGRSGRQFQLGDEGVARQALGLGNGPLSTSDADRLRVRRLAMGNENEARQLLGFTAGQTLTTAEAAQLTALTRDVGVVRDLSDAQVNVLRSHALGGAHAAAHQAEVDQLARTLGVTPQELVRSVGVLGVLDRTQAAALARSSRNPQDIVRDIYQGFGVTIPGAPSASMNALAAALGSSSGRAQGERIVETSQALQAASLRSGTNAESMTRRYLEIMAMPAGAQAEALRNFQIDNGFAGSTSGSMSTEEQARWASFTDATQFQQQSGLLGLGRGGRAVGEGELANAIQRSLGTAGTSGAGPGGQPNNITGTLRVIFDGADWMGDLAGAWGGSTSMTPPPG